MANLLVIDDDKDILRLLEFTLKRAGHQVTICNDGPQGLTITETQKPDLVVCDVMMPNLTGYDFCRQARSNSDLQEMPIIIYSARFQPVDKQTALDAGATDYLPKSISPDALIDRIAELVAGSGNSTTQGIIGLFSLRGGVGVTSLAVNLSIALALAHKTDTVLVDLAPRGGHTALMLGIRPHHHLAQLLAETDGDFSRDSIQAYLSPHRSGIQVLISPPTLEQAASLSQADIPGLIRGVGAYFPMAVLDIPNILDPEYLPILQQLTKLVLVLSPDMPSVQSTALALQELLKQGLSDHKISLVVNQVMPHHAVPASTIQKVTRRPILTTIPFEPDMVKAVNNGQPLLLNSPKSAATAAIGKLAQSIFS